MHGSSKLGIAQEAYSSRFSVFVQSGRSAPNVETLGKKTGARGESKVGKGETARRTDRLFLTVQEWKSAQKRRL